MKRVFIWSIILTMVILIPFCNAEKDTKIQSTQGIELDSGSVKNISKGDKKNPYKQIQKNRKKYLKSVSKKEKYIKKIKKNEKNLEFLQKRLDTKKQKLDEINPEGNLKGEEK